MTAVTLKADGARSALATAPDRTDALLVEVRGDANQAIGDLRRVIYDLRPAVLDELGLLGALNQQLDRFGRRGLLIDLHAPPTLAAGSGRGRRLPDHHRGVAQQRPPRPAHQVTITVAIDGDLWVVVHDDGPASTANGAGWRPGTGLQFMAERVAEVGGTLQAGPTKPVAGSSQVAAGAGMTIRVLIADDHPWSARACRRPWPRWRGGDRGRGRHRPGRHPRSRPASA